MSTDGWTPGPPTREVLQRFNEARASGEHPKDEPIYRSATLGGGGNRLWRQEPADGGYVYSYQDHTGPHRSVQFLEPKNIADTRARAAELDSNAWAEDWDDQAQQMVEDVPALLMRIGELTSERDGAVRKLEDVRKLDSAPRDGTHVLLQMEGGYFMVGHWMNIEPDAGWCFRSPRGLSWAGDPMGWLPLPGSSTEHSGPAATIQADAELERLTALVGADVAQLRRELDKVRAERDEAVKALAWIRKVVLS